MRTISLFSAFILLIPTSWSQETTFPKNGVDDYRQQSYAFVNAILQMDHRRTVENGTLLIEAGKIVAAGSGVKIPSHAVTIDVNGSMIYPSFVEIYSDYGLPKPKEDEGGSFGDEPQMESDKKGAFGWNQAIMPEFNAADNFKTDLALDWRFRTDKME